LPAQQIDATGFVQDQVVAVVAELIDEVAGSHRLDLSVAL
jgi:hypothetical protein